MRERHSSKYEQGSLRTYIYIDGELTCSNTENTKNKKINEFKLTVNVHRF